MREPEQFEPDDGCLVAILFFLAGVAVVVFAFHGLSLVADLARVLVSSL